MRCGWDREWIRENETSLSELNEAGRVPLGVLLYSESSASLDGSAKGTSFNDIVLVGLTFGKGDRRSTVRKENLWLLIGSGAKNRVRS